MEPAKMCNGTRKVVKHLRNDLIAATILTGCHRGQDVLTPRIPLIATDLVISYQTAYAINVNGQTFKVTGLYFAET